MDFPRAILQIQLEFHVAPVVTTILQPHLSLSLLFRHQLGLQRVHKYRCSDACRPVVTMVTLKHHLTLLDFFLQIAFKFQIILRTVLVVQQTDVNTIAGCHFVHILKTSLNLLLNGLLSPHTGLLGLWPCFRNLRSLNRLDHRIYQSSTNLCIISLNLVTTTSRHHYGSNYES